MRGSLIAFCLGSCFVAGMAQAASPPKQPESGPGGADYKQSEVTKRGIGTASAGTFVFHAAGAAAEPRPVVVFLHSWGAVNPALYGGWIEHLARKGNLVLYPRFQDVNKSRPADASVLAANLIKTSLETLANDADARPDVSRVAFIGHLAGVPIALNLAAAAATYGIPAPKLVFGLMPGGIVASEKEKGIVLQDLSTIPADTLLIAMSGDRDHLPGDRASRKILQEASAIPASRKLFIRASSDDHGYPALTATLTSPGSPKPDYDIAAIKLPPDPPRDPKVRNTWRWTSDMALSGQQTILTQQLGTNGTDTLDYLAFWKTFDMAANAAFAGQDAAALRRDPKFIDMGSWSDGWPVRRLSADMPKVEGQDDKPERGPRRRLNSLPAEIKQTLSQGANTGS